MRNKAKLRTRLATNLYVAAVDSNSEKKNWRDLFKKDLESHNEQGLYLKGLRLREGYTQKQLGDLIGVSQNNISAMEHGRRSIGKVIAQRLAYVFDVNYQNFL